MGAPYIYDITRLRVKDLHSATYIYVVRRLRVNILICNRLCSQQSCNCENFTVPVWF